MFGFATLFSFGHRVSLISCASEKEDRHSLGIRIALLTLTLTHECPTTGDDRGTRGFRVTRGRRPLTVASLPRGLLESALGEGWGVMWEKNGMSSVFSAGSEKVEALSSFQGFLERLSKEVPLGVKKGGKLGGGKCSWVEN